MVVQPLNIATVLPHADLPRAIHLDKRALPMLLAVLPLAVVHATVFPLEDTHALPLIIHEVALVLPPVSPLEQAAPMQLMLLPFARVLLAVGPDVAPLTTDLILKECARVDRPVSEGKRPLAIFLPILVAAIIPRTIRPSLDTLAMLFIFEPVAHVRCPVRMPVSSMAMGFVVEPHTLIDVAISVHQDTLSVGLIVLPHPLVARGVWPDLHTATMFLSIETLASISASIRMLCRSLIQLIIGFNVSASAPILPPSCLIALRAHTLLVAPTLISILYLKLLPLLIDIYLVLIVALVLFDGDFALGVGAGVRNAIASAISH